MVVVVVMSTNHVVVGVGIGGDCLGRMIVIVIIVVVFEAYGLLVGYVKCGYLSTLCFDFMFWNFSM